MPFRPGIISSGEDLVGETVSLNRKLRQGVKQKVLHAFEDEQELFDYSDQLDRQMAGERELINERRSYEMFWANQKMEELSPDCTVCSTCHSCLDHEHRFKCLCSEGKRMLSPYKLAWINGSIKRHWQFNIWEVGVGYVPKERA